MAVRKPCATARSHVQISVPGAQAFTLDEPIGEEDAFLVPFVGEFAHLHPSYDGSLHLFAQPAVRAYDAGFTVLVRTVD